MTKEEFKKEFADRLNMLKNDMDVTYREKERQTGIPRTSLRMWTLGDVGPSGYYVALLSEYFGVSADYLLGLSDDMGRTSA
jgi:transcriptional regulator with XRE-family HTH domain